MAYRNKTYVIFDADNDMWAYAYMKGWKSNENLEFDFYDAHGLRPLTDRASDETVYRRLRERFSNAKQVIVLVGEKTKALRKFVRWELEIALDLGLPIIAVNLNDARAIDIDRCPPIVRSEYVVHCRSRRGLFNLRLTISLMNTRSVAKKSGPCFYEAKVYKDLRL
jgi:hypothetical protein